jgi:hypothetical protein
MHRFPFTLAIRCSKRRQGPYSRHCQGDGGGVLKAHNDPRCHATAKTTGNLQFPSQRDLHALNARIGIVTRKAGGRGNARFPTSKWEPVEIHKAGSFAAMGT